MKFKTQQEIQEDSQEKKGDKNPIHDYLDFVNYAKAQIRVLKSNPQSNLNLTILENNDTALKYIFNWKPNNNYTLVNKGNHKDFVTIAYEVCSMWIEKYNTIINKIEPFHARVINIHAYLPTSLLGDVMQAYRDFQDSPEEAEKKWFKCE